MTKRALLSIGTWSIISKCSVLEDSRAAVARGSDLLALAMRQEDNYLSATWRRKRWPGGKKVLFLSDGCRKGLSDDGRCRAKYSLHTDWECSPRLWIVCKFCQQFVHIYIMVDDPSGRLSGFYEIHSEHSKVVRWVQAHRLSIFQFMYRRQSVYLSHPTTYSTR